MLIPFVIQRKKLIAIFNCPTCGNKIKENGYNDKQFFEILNEQPKNKKCINCNEPYLSKWTPEGIQITWVDLDIKTRNGAILARDIEDAKK